MSAGRCRRPAHGWRRSSDAAPAAGCRRARHRAAARALRSARNAGPCSRSGPASVSAILAMPRSRAVEHERHERALAARQRARFGMRGAVVEAERAGCRDRRGIRTVRTFDIVEVERGRRLVARRQEARQDELRHHRIAHGQRPVGVADLLVAHDHRHQAQFAVEVGNRRAAPAPCRRRRLSRGRRRARRFCVGTTASGRPPRLSPPSRKDADRAFLRLDQAAVIVVHADAEPPLAEIKADRIGRFEIGELQDAFVDGGEREIGVFALGKAFDDDGNGDALARRDLVRVRRSEASACVRNCRRPATPRRSNAPARGPSPD